MGIVTRIVTRALAPLACAAVVSLFGCSSNNNNSSNNCSSTSGSASSGLLGASSTSCSTSTQTCSTATGAPACEVCIAQSCCDQALACKDDATCTACAASCTTQAECAACSTDSTTSAYFSCGYGKCATPCTDTGTDTGTASNSCPAAADDTSCDTCQKQSCCTDLVACGNDSQCSSIYAQIVASCAAGNGMSNFSCDAQVVQQSGNAAAAGLLQCVENDCATQCGG